MPARHTFAPLAAFATAAVLLAGCQMPGPHTNVPKTMGSLAQITSISPDASQVLRSGEQVKLKVDVSYALADDTGTLTLIVLAADSSPLAHAAQPIRQRSGKVTLEAAFTVPNTTAVRVYTPLLADGQKSSSVVDGREYAVAPR